MQPILASRLLTYQARVKEIGVQIGASSANWTSRPEPAIKQSSYFSCVRQRTEGFENSPDNALAILARLTEHA